MTTLGSSFPKEGGDVTVAIISHYYRLLLTIVYCLLFYIFTHAYVL